MVVTLTAGRLPRVLFLTRMLSLLESDVRATRPLDDNAAGGVLQIDSDSAVVSENELYTLFNVYIVLA